MLKMKRSKSKESRVRKLLRCFVAF